MKPTPWLEVEPYRVANLAGYESAFGDDFGIFLIPFIRTGVKLRCIVSSGRAAQIEFGDAYAWDHISVSLQNRCPNWHEMSFVKSLFFDDNETAVQLHVPSSDHINCHPNTLHLWRPLLLSIPRPPDTMV